jgi:MoxR-like ATPase
MATDHVGQARIGQPRFCHHGEVARGFRHVFDIFQMPDEGMQRCLFAGMLVENATLLLSGTYGTGKTQLVHLLRKVLFSDGKGGFLFDYESCHQELTAFDVLYHLDLAELQRGKEVVHPKAMVTARLKFLNEIQRANTGFFNAILPLLSEHRITYRDVEFEVPDFVCVMDRNPLDTGSSEIPEAFLDRVDFSFDVPAVHLDEMMTLLRLRRGEAGYHWGGLAEMADSVLTFDQLAEVWDDVKRIDIPKRPALLAGMLGDAFRLCIATERSTARMDFDLDCSNCQFNGEVCSHVLKVPGMRVTTSTLRLAQALAWLDGATALTEDHIVEALPASLAHRLAIRPEELRKKPSEHTWVEEVAMDEILRPKLAFWARALEAYEAGDSEALRALSGSEAGHRDLVVRQLLLMATEA